MKSLELKPTYENLIETLKDDAISRNENIFNFVNILNSIDDSCSIALDGGWGSGKTFFVKQVKLVLEAHNDFITISNKDDKEIIKKLYSCFPKLQEIEPQMCVYYDAWENDNDDDPIMSLIYTIMKSVKECVVLEKNLSIPKAAASILEFFTNKRWSNLVENLKGNSPLKEINTSKTVEEHVKEFLDELFKEHGNRLIVFVDELDRCKPSYAVKVLERIKHYFTNDRITFVFSINTSELQHTIRKHYGNDFNADRYLDRFFDWRLSLPPANLDKYYQRIGFNSGDRPIDVVVTAVISKLKLEIREIEKFTRLTKAATHLFICKSGYYLTSGSEHKALIFSFTFFMPIAIALKMYDSKLYNDFINGNGEKILLEIMSNLDLDYYLTLYGALYRLENSKLEDGTLVIISAEERLKEMYKAMFEHNYNFSSVNVIVGNYSFSEQTRKTFLNAASLLSSLNMFDIEIDEQYV